MRIRLKTGKVVLIVCMLAMGSMGSKAQNQPWSVACIDSLAAAWPDNTIENALDAPGWDARSDTRLVVLQLGDSHIQGGVQPRATRMRMAQAFGIAEVPRGYSVPFAVAGTNEPSETYSSARGGWSVNSALRIRTPAPYGLAAVAFETASKAATMRVKLQSTSCDIKPTTYAEVLFTPVKKMCTPILNGQRPDTIVQSEGYAAYRFEEPPAEFLLSFTPDSAQAYAFRLNGFLFDNPDSPFLFHAAGLNGADVNVHLRNTFLQASVRHLRPTVVILSLGTNDAYSLTFTPLRFAAALRDLVLAVRDAWPAAFIVLTTPNDHLFRGVEENPRLEEACEVIRNLAIELNTGLWDFNRIMGGAGSAYSWYNRGLMAADYLHLSAAGYELQGRLLGVALCKMLSKKKAI